MGSCQSIGALACSRNNTQRATNTPAGNNIENNEEDSVFIFTFSM